MDMAFRLLERRHAQGSVSLAELDAAARREGYRFQAADGTYVNDACSYFDGWNWDSRWCFPFTTKRFKRRDTATWMNLRFSWGMSHEEVEDWLCGAPSPNGWVIDSPALRRI